MKKNIRNWSEMAIWGHYNRGYINAVMNYKELFEIRVGIKKRNTDQAVDRFTWSGISGNPSFDYHTENCVVKTGSIDLRGGYSMITLKSGDFVFDLEFSCGEQGFVYKIVPVTFSPAYLFTVAFYVGSRCKEPAGTAQMGDRFCDMRNQTTGTVCRAYVLCAYAETKENIMEIDGRETVYITDIPGMNTDKCEEELRESERREADFAVEGTGYLCGETVPSMLRAAGWNKVYDYVNHAFQIDVSRLWAPESCYYSFYWDNLLDALPAALGHKQSAYDQFESICSEFKNGYLPQCSWEWGSSAMINPPIGSYCLWKVYEQYRERELLILYFPYFYATNRYLFRTKRDCVTGLISLLGSQQEDRALEVSASTTAMESALATGLDNSPMYADKENFIDVGMSSVYVLDCLCLSRIAAILGDTEKQTEMDMAYRSAKDAVNTFLWDEKHGIYCNRGLDGMLKTVYTPTSFYPLLACDVPKERLDRLINGHLLNEDEFWGEYVIPSVDKRHPAYRKQDYWEGCAWGPMNFLVYEGLRNSGALDTASALARKSTDMYRRNWDRFGWVLENYSTVTGSITHNCVPMYTWGTLMAYTGVQELFRSGFSGLELGSLSGQTQGLINVSVRGCRMSIEAKDGIRIDVDGRNLIQTDIPALIREDPSDPCLWHISARSEGTLLTADGERFSLHEGTNAIQSTALIALFGKDE